MGALQNDYYNFAAGTVTVTTTAETVIATTRAISSAFPSQQVFVTFGFEFLTGTGTTGLTFKIVRGASVGGTAVYTGNALNPGASSRLIYVVAVTDSQSGDIAGQTYSVTATQTGATGNGAANNVWSTVTVG